MAANNSKLEPFWESNAVNISPLGYPLLVIHENIV